VLKQTADPAVVDAIQRLIEKGEDRELNRDQRAGFFRADGLDEEKVISGFLHASRLGLFDLAGTCCVPAAAACSAPIHAEIAAARRLQLRAVRGGYEASVDEQVEVAFTVSPRSGASPRMIPTRCRSGNINADVLEFGHRLRRRIVRALTDEVTLERIELPAGEKAVLSLQLPKQFIIVFEPVTHAAQFIDVQGEPTKERQQLRSCTTTSMRRPEPPPCVPARCGCRSTIRPARGCCRRCLSPPTAFII
jgi:hypothetical protein